ncbi:MAG: outer membrane protein assembly factor BamB, partial [Chromatiales bacterium]|jgi:outer membrane protein assembly factor BamB
VEAIDRENGKRLWQVDLEVPISGGPGVAGDLVLVGTSEAELIALDVESGEQRWRRRVSSEVLSKPAGESGVVAVRTIDDRVSGVEIATGEERWNYAQTVPVLTLRGNSSPIVHNGRVIVGFANGKMVGLALDSGKRIWETSIATPHGRSELERVVDLDADPVLVEGVVYGAGFQSELAAVSEITGVILWKREVSSYAGLDADWRQVYVTDAEDHVWALDATNGATLWQQKKLHARHLSAPAIVSFDRLVVGDLEGYLHWLATDDGRMLARVRVGSDAIRSKPLVRDGVVYVMNDNGRLAALRAERLDSE